MRNGKSNEMLRPPARSQSLPIPIHDLSDITFQPQVAEDNVNFKRIGHERAPSESEDDESEKEAQAKQTNGPKQDTCRGGVKPETCKTKSPNMTVLD